MNTNPGDFDFPSFEEGWPRRSNNATLPQVIGAVGEVRPFLQQEFDLFLIASPYRARIRSAHARCALIKVARRLFVGRSAPSSKEGKFASIPIHSCPHGRSEIEENQLCHRM